MSSTYNALMFFLLFSGPVYIYETLNIVKPAHKLTFKNKVVIKIYGFHLRYRVLRFVVSCVTSTFEDTALNVGLVCFKETLNRLKVSLNNMKNKDPLSVTALHYNKIDHD